MERKGQPCWLDVKAAFLYGDARTSLCVELPPEDPLSASGRYVGKLERAMYGTRDAPMIWQDHLRKAQLDMKFKESVAHLGVFQHETRDILPRRSRGWFCCAQVYAMICCG